MHKPAGFFLPMSVSKKVAPPPPLVSRSTVWTAERIDKLSVVEVKQLRENAERLQEPEVAELCTKSLKGRPRVVRAASAAPKKAKPKVPVTPE